VAISQDWFGASAQEIKKKWFEPKRTLIFVAMNDIEGYSAGSDGGTRRKKMEIHLPAITALKLRGHFACKGQPAAFAEGWFDKAQILTAFRAHVAVSRCCPLGTADLTQVRIEKGKRGIKPAFGKV
jgi:hypothetical protein